MIVAVRNGSELCQGCVQRGCMRVWGTKDDDLPNTFEEYVSDEECSCCGRDFVVNDDFGI